MPLLPIYVNPLKRLFLDQYTGGWHCDVIRDLLLRCGVEFSDYQVVSSSGGIFRFDVSSQAQTPDELTKNLSKEPNVIAFDSHVNNGYSFVSFCFDGDEWVLKSPKGKGGYYRER